MLSSLKLVYALFDSKESWRIKSRWAPLRTRHFVALSIHKEAVPLRVTSLSISPYFILTLVNENCKETLIWVRKLRKASLGEICIDFYLWSNSWRPSDFLRNQTAVNIPRSHHSPCQFLHSEEGSGVRLWTVLMTLQQKNYSLVSHSVIYTGKFRSRLWATVNLAESQAMSMTHTQARHMHPSSHPWIPPPAAASSSLASSGTWLE